MKCQICGSENIELDYEGHIRDGATNVKTEEKVKIFRCTDCGVIWHHKTEEKNYEEYYVSEDYRRELESTSDIIDFYRMHDYESFDKFTYVGTEMSRNKIVTDIGCGGGAFLDYLSGVAKEVIAIEPSKTYRSEMEKKGYRTYAFTDEAIKDNKNKIELAVSFDVIEHVDDPQEFLNDIYHLLSSGGKAIIGTPTETPIMRELLGPIYEENLLFSTQHLWIFSDRNLKLMAEKAGFNKIEVKYKQRYGLGNLLAWMQYHKPKGHFKYGFITETMDEVWKRECEAQGLSDYILLYLEK